MRPSSLEADLGRHLHPVSADQLLLAAGRGEQAALGTLFDRTASVVYGCLQRLLSDPTAAAQSTANVYVQLWRAATRFRPAGGSAHSMLTQLIKYELIHQHHHLDRTGFAPIDGTPES